MDRVGAVALALAAALFVLFLVNVMLGAFARSAFLGDIAEMLVLFAACFAFVIGVLRREMAVLSDAAARRR